MIIQNIPTAPLLHANGKDIHPQWGAYFDANTNQLQSLLSNEGYILPAQPTTKFSSLTRNFAILGDSTTNTLHIYLPGVGWKQIVTM